MSTFSSRSNSHDNWAIPIVRAELQKNDLASEKYGVEIHDKIFQQTLYKLGRQSDMALRDRYKPDLYVLPTDTTINTIPPLLCEVKSDPNGYPNFSVEFDSYCAAKIWDNNQKEVIYAFVDLDDSVRICWLKDIGFTIVKVPMRFDFEKNILELKDKYPDIPFVAVPHTGGAGTPYFLISKRSSYLKSLSVFIK